MKARHNLARLLAVGVAVVALAGCTTYDRRADNTLLGAGLGTAAGGVFSGGDPLYMLGGAAAGGLLGNVLTSDDRSYGRGRGWDRRYDQDRGWKRGRDHDRHRNVNRSKRHDRGHNWNNNNRSRSWNDSNRGRGWSSRPSNRDFPIGGWGHSRGSSFNNN